MRRPFHAPSSAPAFSAVLRMLLTVMLVVALFGCSYHFNYVEVTPQGAGRVPSAEQIETARQIAAEVADVYGLRYGGALPDRSYAALYSDGDLQLNVATGLERAPITFIIAEPGAWRPSERAKLLVDTVSDSVAARLPGARVVRWSRLDPFRF